MQSHRRHQHTRTTHPRFAAAAAALTASLLLSGCAHRPEPHIAAIPQNSNVVDNVRTILAAIEQDPCSTDQTNDYRTCEGRYVTQITQVARTTLSSATQFPDQSGVREAAQKLITTSDAFQKLDCGNTPDPDCRTTLHTVDYGLQALSRATNATAPPTS